MNNSLKTLFEQFQERPIAYMSIYSKITGSVTAGILLSQIVYWDGVKKHDQFYKTDKDFCEELSMGPTELKNAKKTLIKMEIVSTILRSIPAKTHYQLNTKKLIELITSNAKISEPISMNSANKLGGNNLTNTESTTKITTETSIYALSYQKASLKDSVGNYLKNIPTKSEDINKAVLYYLECYSNYTQHPHPPITLEQYKRVIDSLLHISTEYDLGIEQLEQMVDSWFTDKKVKSNYNIVHFTMPGVLSTHYHKSFF